jgi:ubiquitin-protein ligase
VALSPRQKRLANDYELLRVRFDGNPNILVEPLGTVPPERYRITYQVPSLRIDASNKPIINTVTVVDVELPMGYPRDKPRAVAHGNVFHPNFGDYICIADFWSPAQSLADIVLDIGNMLQWQKFNIQSPLNAVAADWAVKNSSSIPVGEINLTSGTNTLELNIISTKSQKGM